jgi:hypothetical protein
MKLSCIWDGAACKNTKASRVLHPGASLRARHLDTIQTSKLTQIPILSASSPPAEKGLQRIT